jgi:hypothetical protein
LIASVCYREKSNKMAKYCKILAKILQYKELESEFSAG